MKSKELKELNEIAHKVYALIPANEWSYDDGITDSEGHRGKCQQVECITKEGKLEGIVLNPYYSSENLEHIDIVGKYIAAVDPLTVIYLIDTILDLGSRLDNFYDDQYDNDTN
mgnify:CR=1 FL=1